MRNLLILAILVAACSSDSATDDDLQARRLFIAKANRTLRPGVELSIAEIDQLLDRSDAEIIDAFLADPASTRAVLGIGLHVLGVPLDRAFDGERWDPNAMRYWPAVSAARAFRTGGDPLAELKSMAPAVPLGVMQGGDRGFIEFDLPEANVPYDADLQTQRAAVFDALMARMDRNIAYLQTQPEPFDIDATCAELIGPSFAINYEVLMGGPQAFDIGKPIIDESVFRIYDRICFYDPAEDVFPDRATMLAQAQVMKVKLREMYDYYEPLYRQWESDPDSAFTVADPEVLRYVPEYGDQQYYAQFWTDSPNSSTNYNRRRGAYVLDRYFCDDLRPVGAALPEPHGDSRHASEPACQACHFKLDPMAGFFRRYGYGGYIHSDDDAEIFFDDGATMDFARYESAWRAPEGSGRAFDVGYIRSTSDPAQNSYGSSFADLIALVGSAPEVDRCVVQRMWESLIGEEQVVDPGFLDDVTRELRERGAEGFRGAIARIVNSATFHAPERNTTVCYDLAPDAVAANRPPCAVASTLQTYCGSCHSPTVRQGGLDLLTWSADGTTDGLATFPHRDATGREVPRAATLASMIDRLRTSDPSRQMPMSGAMPIHVREQLVVWLEAQP